MGESAPAENRETFVQVAPFELKAGELLRLHVFLDRSILEVFINKRQCLTQRIYPSGAESLGVSLTGHGGVASVRRLDAWEVAPSNAW